MQDTVKVVRYIRPETWDRGKYGKNTNLYGITLLFEIHYPTKTVTATWSVCNGDNFRKYLGKVLAGNSPVCVKFGLDLVEKEWGLTDALIESLVDLLGHNKYVGDFEDTINLFLEATRKLRG